RLTAAAAAFLLASVGLTMLVLISYLLGGLSALPYLAAGATLASVAFQIWSARRVVHRQELEADAFAVKLGASSVALESALGKLQVLNRQDKQARGALAIFNPAAAHPLHGERIVELRRRTAPAGGHEGASESAAAA